MPSDESLLQQAEEWKTKGNEAFSASKIPDAISAYSQGLVACDRIQPTPTLKATLLSNRAMCHLKVMQLRPCIDDCTMALACDGIDAKLRAKVLYRRAKARFLLANLDANNIDNALLQDAAKDLLSLLQIDPSNKGANQLLQTVRAQHKVHQQTSAKTPVSQTLEALQTGNDQLHQCKILLGMLDNDLTNTALELGRCGGVQQLLALGKDNSKLAVLALQCLSQAAAHPEFVRKHLVDSQQAICEIVQSSSNPDVLVSALAIYVRILLHADRDNFDKDIEGTTVLDYTCILQTIIAALQHEEKTVIRACLDLLSTWTAGTERDATIRAALSGAGVHDPTVPIPKTQADIRAMTPQELAAHRKRQYDQKLRDQAWAFERSMLICRDGGLKALLKAAISCHDHVVRREMTVAVGRLLANLDDEDKIKEVVKPYLADVSKERDGPMIEEVYNEDEEEKQAAEEEVVESLETLMERAVLTGALLLSKKEVGSWALGAGWSTSADDLPTMINSGDPRAMCLVSEVASSAATVENSRHIVANMLSGGEMEKLIMNPDRDIRSGAASAVAKLGLSDKETDEGEIMGLLQAACGLLEDEGDEAPPEDKNSAKFRHFNSFATSSVERAVEMITYLISNTTVKEELAAGFSYTPNADHTALERLVQVCELPKSGESLSGFGLATIFQHMAVTNTQLRKEGFEGKEITMEQYDELQAMGKTPEEKELMEQEKDSDTQELCNERIRKMAAANVPRAMVALMEGASEHTLEQLVMGLNRMADEQSARGIMIQQGVLTACIKVAKDESPTETDTMKKVIRLARHCIAKMLITTNPALLTSAQRLGSIKPLINLVRDNKAKDLEHFEALLAITNIAGSGEDAKNRIASDKGIPCFHFAMFSDHEMVRRAATEALCNMVPHKAMMDHLAERDNLRLWLAFSNEFEENYECARAAAGCLAMATQDESIALEMVEVPKFKEEMCQLLECGRLEIMHRALVIILNLVMHGGLCREKAVNEGLVAFCAAYIESFKNKEGGDMGFASPEEAQLLPVTVDLAKKVVQEAEATTPEYTE